MRNFIKRNRIITGIVIAELFLLAAGILSALTTERISKTLYAENMNFFYEDMESVTSLDDGSFKIEDGSEKAEAWWCETALPAGRYIVSVEYEAEKIDKDDTWFSIEVPSNLLPREIVRLSRNGTVTEGELILTNDADDIYLSVAYGGRGALCVKSISITEVKRLYQIMKLIFFCAVLDSLYLLFFTDCFAGQKEWKTAFLCISGIIVLASMPMFMNYVPKGHDLEFHMERIAGIADALRGGQFPVRIYPSAQRGYGYPVSIFYGELLLYLPALLHLSGCPLYSAYRIYVVLINILTCLTAYVCFGKIFRNRKAGLLGAFLYTCSVYRIISVYLRAAVGEYSAMVFFPMLLYAGCLLVGDGYEQKERDRAWLWLAVGASGLCQTHVLSMEIAFLFWILFMVFYWKKLLQKQAMCAMLKALAATLAWNLWFLIPFLTYYMTGEYRVNAGELWKIQSSGLYLPQLFAIFLKGNGYNEANSIRQEMPIAPGASLVLGLVVFLVFAFYTKERKDRTWKLGKGTAIFGMFALWLSSIYCPWDQLLKCGEKAARFFFSVQYVWRYLGAATLFLTVTAISAAVLLNRKKGMYPAGIFLSAVLLLHILSLGSFYTNYLTEADVVKTMSKEGAFMNMDILYVPLAFQYDCIENAEILCGDGIQTTMPRRIGGGCTAGGVREHIAGIRHDYIAPDLLL